jgi:hypothetical protein
MKTSKNLFGIKKSTIRELTSFEIMSVAGGTGSSRGCPPNTNPGCSSNGCPSGCVTNSDSGAPKLTQGYPC